MVKVRTAKIKGSAFEYDCQYSISKIMPEIYRTSERGFQLQYDLESNTAVFECKRLKAISWNQAKKYWLKLAEKAPEGKVPYLLFKSNRQPCLVMFDDGVLKVMEFEDVFATPFEKHPSTRKK